MGTPYEMTELDHLGAERWNGFVEEVDEGWMFHRSEYIDGMTTWPGRKNESFAVIDHGGGDRLTAIVPLILERRKAGGVVPVQMLISPAGVALLDDLGDSHRRKIYRFIQQCLHEKAEETGAQKIIFKQSPLAPALRGDACPRVNPLIYLGMDNTATQTWIVDLTGEEDDVWERMEGRARTDIRKARDNNVTIREASTSGQDLKIYYDLHTATYNRTGVTPHPKAYFELIWDKFLSKGLSKVFFAELNDDVVAAVNIGRYKNAGKYWTGASSMDGLKASANSLLQWHTISWLMDENCEWYEVGEAFPGAEDDKRKGLNQFKKSFGGELYPFYRGETVVRPLKQIGYRLAKSLRDRFS